MTRSERLMQLIRLLKSHRRISIEQLSSTCAVSHRTIYRDMATLAKMNVPVYYDDGYRLARTAGFPLADFGVEDLELICYCLRNNPLADNSFFARRFRLIERQVGDKLKQRTGTDRLALFLIERDTEQAERTPESSMLERFLRAIIESRKIELAGQGRHLFPGFWVPLSIRARREATIIVVARSVADCPEEVNIGDIHDIRVSDIQFDRLQADYLRRSVAQQKKDLTRAEA